MTRRGFLATSGVLLLPRLLRDLPSRSALTAEEFHAQYIRPAVLANIRRAEEELVRVYERLRFD